uniref:WD repeat, SAM and U-box domain-containing protein 1 n=1 Tax=Poecilia mexicana TaxID=48701 RepID=A0A3B3XEB7_9TELE
MVSLIRAIRDHTDEISCCAFSQSALVTGSADKTLRVYSTADFKEFPFSPLTGHGYGVHRCCFSSCGSYLLSCSTDGSIIVWSSETGELLSAVEHPGRSPLRVCALAPDSCLLLAGACDGTVALWDFPSKTLRRYTSCEASIVACSFSPCSQVFVTGCTHGDLKLWDDHISLLLAQKDAHDLGVTCCSFAPHFKIEDSCVELRLASCGQDSLLKIWIVSQPWTMMLLHILTGQTAPVLSCAFSADGELVVSGSVDKSVTVYDAVSNVVTNTLHFPVVSPSYRYVTAVALSPAFGLMATGSMDRSVNVWKIGDGYEETGKYFRLIYFSHSQGRKLPGHSRLLLADWTEEDVQSWLCEEGLDELVMIFKTNNIDGSEVNHMSKETVAELGIESVGLRGRLLRKIEALKAEQSGSEAPDEFLCPITRELMKDPVIAADGYSYERESIESWIRGKNKTSPMTNLPLRTTLLTPNRSLKMAITRWKSSQ